MIDANSQFFAILTNVGLAKQANADALGIPWKITEMGVGDANLTDPIPSATQTRLINEWRRRPLNQLKVDAVDPAIIIAEQIIPADEGGRWIREIGLYDADGDLVAVANCAPSYKPLLSQGSGRTQVVRMNFIVNNSSNVTLKIDPAVVLASRAYVDAAILEVLPANKMAGEFTRVKVNHRGVVMSGDNPSTLAAMGITDTYTKPQIESMIAQASALPVGTMVAFPVNKVAPGFLEIDGSVKSIAAYPDLAAFLGTAFNLGNEGAGNFRLPESRGEFLRGWDHGRGIDAGRDIGSYQLDALQNITGNWSAFQATSVGQSHSGAFQGAGSYSFPQPTGSVVNGPVSVNFDASRVARASTETRGRNLAVMWCIKAWNAPINQGNIDVAALVALAAQATENNQGTAKIATQAQVNAGTDDATIVTPKKLRFGFSVSWGASGNIVFPTWLGGIVIQWISTNTGQIAANFAETVTAPWPMEFPNACWFAIGGMGQSPSGNGYASVRIDSVTVANVTSSTFAHITGWVMRKIYAIGR
jgi:phage-related tail fiber protein